MDTINILLGIIGLIITVGIALIPYFRKVYFLGPELTIEVLPDGGSSGNRGYSSKNDKSKGYLNVEEAIHIFEVTWKIKIKITNNSTIIAYYPEIEFINQQLGFSNISELDRNKPIKENEQLVINATYKIFEECTGRDRTQIKGLPDHLKDLKIVLSYYNPSKKPFFTIYSHSKQSNRNKYTRTKPKELKQIGR
jgi:hypothetical protein